MSFFIWVSRSTSIYSLLIPTSCHCALCWRYRDEHVKALTLEELSLACTRDKTGLITTNYNNYCVEQKPKVLREHRGEVPTKTRSIKEDFIEERTPVLSLKDTVEVNWMKWEESIPGRKNVHWSHICRSRAKKKYWSVLVTASSSSIGWQWDSSWKWS